MMDSSASYRASSAFCASLSASRALFLPFTEFCSASETRPRDPDPAELESPSVELESANSRRSGTALPSLSKPSSSLSSSKNRVHPETRFRFAAARRHPLRPVASPPGASRSTMEKPRGATTRANCAGSASHRPFSSHSFVQCSRFSAPSRHMYA